MGFSTLIDILGSIVVGGMLFMILLRVNDTATENTFFYGGELLVQSNLVATVTLLEHDFRKIGFCKDWNALPDPTQAIIFADSNRIAFLTDENADGVVDTLEYFTGTTAALSMTPNPKDKMLYRVVNGDSLYANLGVTQFHINYYDAMGNPLSIPVTPPGAIQTMEIDITVENTAAYDDKYSSAFWRQIRLAARNLGNR